MTLRYSCFKMHNQYVSSKLVMDTGLRQSFEPSYPKLLQHIRDDLQRGYDFLEI